MRTLLATLALLPASAVAATYGTPETCRGDFSGTDEIPVIVIDDRLYEPGMICMFDGRCADADGKTWSGGLTSVVVDGDEATVTYEDGEVILARCE